MKWKQNLLHSRRALEFKHFNPFSPQQMECFLCERPMPPKLRRVQLLATDFEIKFVAQANSQMKQLFVDEKDRTDDRMNECKNPSMRVKCRISTSKSAAHLFWETYEFINGSSCVSNIVAVAVQNARTVISFRSTDIGDEWHSVSPLIPFSKDEVPKRGIQKRMRRINTKIQW